MFRMIKKSVSVPIVMACAAAGTVHLLKALEKVAPGEKAPQNAVKDGKGEQHS